MYTIQPPKNSYLQQLMNRKNSVSSSENIFKPVRQACSMQKIQNFARSFQKFEQTDINPKKLKLKKEIQDFKDPDILELRPKQWNNSTFVPINQQNAQTHERRLQQIRMGLFDDRQIKLSEKKAWQGTETRDDYSGWNISTDFDRNKIRQLIDPQYTSKAVSQKLLSNDYKSPYQRQIDYVDYQRSLKIQERDIRGQLRESYAYQNPNSSQEKVDAGVFRLNYEAILKAQQLKQLKENYNYAFSPDLKLTLKPKKVIKYNHTGKWGVIQILSSDQDKKYTWSCCLNEDVNSEGCNRYTKDDRSWNYSGYTN